MSISISTKEKAALAEMSKVNGFYLIMKELKNLSADASGEMGPGAIVHKDAFIISEAVREMQLAHPLRALDTEG